MVKFKVSEMWRSLLLYAKTRNLDHLGDIVRILLWPGDGGEEDLGASVHF